MLTRDTQISDILSEMFTELPKPINYYEFHGRQTHMKAISTSLQIDMVQSLDKTRTHDH